jgi:signal transduction histidine kinase
MLALVLLSTFSLVAYRHSLGEWLRQQQAATQLAARDAALTLAEAPSLSPPLLRRLVPGARRIAVVDDHGQLVAASEPFDSSDLLAPLDGPPAEPTAVGPGAEMPDTIAGFAPLVRGGRNLVVRVDQPAELLAGQIRGLRILYWVALPINFLVVGLVFLFLRYLLKPFDTLLEQARRVDEGQASSGDEIAFLLATFERAVNALAGSDRSVDDEITTLQRALAPSLESGLLLLDREARVLALNSVGCELLGVDMPAAGTAVAKALPAHPVLLEILTSAIDSGQGVARQETQVHSGDEQKTLGLTVHALRRDDGSTRGFLVLFVDLTEVRRKAKEESLAKGLAQLGGLAAGVAHELRNSLATLRGYLTLAERQPADEAVSDYLAEMRRESDQLARVVEDFLTFARPESAQVEEVDLVALTHRAAADPALGPDAVIVDSGELRTACIKGDPQLLERAVKNLLHNSAQAAPPDDQEPIICRLRRRQGNLELAIEDRGPGLPDSVRESLFQPFVTTRSDGVGLGLSLAHRIVDLHGGALLLEDRSGGGTRALITFPAGASVT